MNLLFYGILCALQAMNLCFHSFVVNNDVNVCAYISPFDAIHLQFLKISCLHKNEPESINNNQETCALQVYPLKFTENHSLSTHSEASSLNLINNVINLKTIPVVAMKKKPQTDILLNWFHIYLTPLSPFQNFFGFQTAALLHLQENKINQLSYLLKCLQKIITSLKNVFHPKIQPDMLYSTYFLNLKYFFKWLWTGNPLDLHIRLKHTSKLKEDPIQYENRIIVGSHFPHHMHHQYDFAAYDAGARILAYSSSIKNVRAPQRPGYDSYLLAPCTKPIWFVMAFNTQVYIKSIGLVSQEFFSSAFRTIEIFGSDMYPTRHWRLLAVLRAHYDTPKELFNLKSICEKFTSSDCWVKYIRFKVVDYYQIEDYNHCTLNRFQVFGLDVLESLNNKLTHAQETPYAQVYTEPVESSARRSTIQNKRNPVSSPSEDISTVHSSRIELSHRPHVSPLPNSDLFLFNSISLCNPKKMKNIPLSSFPILQENMMIQVPSQNNLYGCYVAHETMYHEKTEHPDMLTKVPHPLNHRILNNSCVNTDVYTKKASTFTLQGFSKRQSMIQKIFVENMQDKRHSESSCSPHEHNFHKNTYRLSAKRLKEKVEQIPPTPPFLLRLVDRLTTLEATSKQLTNTTSHLLQGYDSVFDQLTVLRNQMETALQMPNISNLESFFFMNQTKETSKEFIGLVTFLFLNVFNDFLIKANISNSSVQKAFQTYQNQNCLNSFLLNPVFVNSIPLKHQYSASLKLHYSWIQFKSLAFCKKLLQYLYLSLSKLITTVFQLYLFGFSFLQKHQLISYNSVKFYREMRHPFISRTFTSNSLSFKNTSIYHRFATKAMCYNLNHKGFQTLPCDSHPVNKFVYFYALFCEVYFLLQYFVLSTIIKIVLILSSSISFVVGQLYTHFLKPCFNYILNSYFTATFSTLAKLLIFLLKEITLDRILFVTFVFSFLRSWKTQPRQGTHKKNYKSCVKAPRFLQCGNFGKHFQRLRRKISKKTTHISNTAVHVSSNRHFIFSK